MIRLASAASLAMCAFAGSAGAADPVYDAADQFSLAGNPNGVWTYGSLPTGGTALAVFTDHLTINTLISWRRNEGGTGTPGFYANQTAVTYTDFQQNLLPGELSCAPGQNSQCTLRFTAPETRRYEVTAMFEGLTFASIAKSGGSGTTTDVTVLHNGASLGVLTIRGTRAASARTFHETLELQAGARLDFAVSGSFDGFASDLTRMEVNVVALPVPEPAAAALMLAGVAVVGAATRRRRRG